MPNEPVWLTLADVSRLHQAALERFGGLAGIRDEGAIQSAISAPLNLFLHEGVDDPIALAARYCVRLCGNHGFADGNKRVASAAMLEFLEINGISVATSDTADDDGETELSLLIKGFASHNSTEQQLYSFIEARAFYNDAPSPSDEFDQSNASE